MFKWLSRENRYASDGSFDEDDAGAVLASALTAVSHEIRTPLTTIQGVLGVLNESPLEPHQKRLVETAVRAGGQLQAWIDNMADYAAPEEAAVERAMQTINLAQEIRAAADLVTLETPEGAISLQVDVDPDLSTLRLGDARRARRAVFNLIDGVAKSVVDGAVRVRARLRESDQVVISVRDARGRWDPERRELALRVLAEGRTEGADRRDGGAALAFVAARRLARWMDGDVTARPQEDDLILELVFAAPIAEAGAGGDGPGSSGGVTPLRVLVAEDNMINQKLIQVLLESLQCHARIVSSGAEAVSVAQEETFDIVFMDLHMPAMDGFTTAEALRARGVTAPIVALTADVSHDTQSRAMDAGMAAFVKKPIDTDELSAVIARLIPSRA